MAARRRSSQYSLFPNCSTASLSSSSSLPSDSLPTKRSPSRQSSVSSLSSSGTSRDFADLPLRERPGVANDKIDNTILPAESKRKSKLSERMGRLIPLKLDNAPAPKSKANNIPSPSFLSKSSSLTSFLPESPTLPRPQLKKSRPAPVTDLTILPYTDIEWKTVMEEVKALYSKGQYKHCSLRCKQILDGIKDPHKVHPLYSIYLSFFAASSLEMTASTLHNHSSNKLPLFQESLSFYQQAQSCVNNASYTSPTTSHRSNVSITSSVRSSIDSVFSSPAHSARSSMASSPTDDTPLPAHKRGISTSSSMSSLNSTSSRTHKKKVSFSIDAPTFLSSESESDVPPTSASLQSSLLDAFPAPPTQPDPSITSIKDLTPTTTTTPSPTTTTQDSIAIYFHAQSLGRYKSHLQGLSTQLNYHVSSIHSQISQLSNARKARRSNLPTQFSEHEEASLGISVGDVSRGEMQKVELRERIRRLREVGWKRERFDGERYRLLCERAMGEVCDRL